MKRRWSGPARTWCKMCRVWIADNKVQRMQHEQASKHKEAVANFLKEIARKNDAKRKEQAKVAKIVEGANSANPRRDSAVARAFLEAAAGGRKSTQSKAKGDGKFKVDQHTDTKQDGRLNCEGHVVVDETVGNNLKDQLDENGYPLSAETVYGTWETVPEQEVEEEVEKEETNVESEQQTTEEVHHSEEKIEEKVAVLELTEEEKRQRAEIETGFKKRKVPASKKRRKKTGRM